MDLDLLHRRLAAPVRKERQEGLDHLLTNLGDEKFLTYMDSRTAAAGRGGRDAWPALVAKVAEKVVDVEISEYERRNVQPTHAIRAAEVLLRTLRVVESRGTFLTECAQNLFSHVGRVLRVLMSKTKRYEGLATQYVGRSSILGLLLNVPQYCDCISVNILNGTPRECNLILTELMTILEEIVKFDWPKGGTSPTDLAAECLKSLLVNYPRNLVHVFEGGFLPFFKVQFLAESTHSRTRASLLGAMNHILRTHGLDVVHVATTLAHDVTPILFTLWDSLTAGKGDRDLHYEIVEFLRVQLRLHRPELSGRQLPFSSEWAVRVASELDQHVLVMSDTTSFNDGAQPLDSRRRAFLDLASDFWWESREPHTQTRHGDGSPSAKRPRVDVHSRIWDTCIAAIGTHLTTLRSSEMAISWIQLLYVAVKKHPSILSPDQLHAALDRLLSQLKYLGKSKALSVTSKPLNLWILCCIDAFASTSKLPERWKEAWNVILSCSGDDVVTVFGTALGNGLLSPTSSETKAVWQSLAFREGSALSVASVRFVARWAHAADTGVREQLIKWLMRGMAASTVPPSLIQEAINVAVGRKTVPTADKTTPETRLWHKMRALAAGTSVDDQLDALSTCWQTNEESLEEPVCDYSSLPASVQVTMWDLVCDTAASLPNDKIVVQVIASLLPDNRLMALLPRMIVPDCITGGLFRIVQGVKLSKAVSKAIYAVCDELINRVSAAASVIVQQSSCDTDDFLVIDATTEPQIDHHIIIDTLSALGYARTLKLPTELHNKCTDSLWNVWRRESLPLILRFEAIRVISIAEPADAVNGLAQGLATNQNEDYILRTLLLLIDMSGYDVIRELAEAVVNIVFGTLYNLNNKNKLNRECRLCLIHAIRSWFTHSLFDQAVLDTHWGNVTADDIFFQLFINMLHDPDFTVRRYMARAAAYLLIAYDDHARILNDVMSKGLMVSLHDTGQPHLAITALITLGEMLRFGQGLECDVITTMCSFARTTPHHTTLIHSIFASVAHRLGYPSVDVLFAEHSGIINRWIDAGIPIVEFPASLAGYSDAKSFVMGNAATIVPALLLGPSSAPIERGRVERQGLNNCIELARSLSIDVKMLFNGAFPQLFALMYPLKEVNKGLYASEVYAVLCKQWEAATVRNRAGLVLEDILCSLLNLVCHLPGEPEPHTFSPTIIRNAVSRLRDEALRPHHDVADSVADATKKRSVFAARDRARRLMSHLKLMLLREGSPSHGKFPHTHQQLCNGVPTPGVRSWTMQFRALQAMSVFIDELDDNITKPHIILHVLHTLSAALPGLHQDTRIEACRLIQEVFDRCKRLGTLNEFGLHLSLVVPPLVSAAQSEPAGGKCITVLAALLGEPDLHPHLRKRSPLPDVDCFSGLAEQIKQVWGSISIDEEIEGFIGRDVTVTGLGHMFRRVLEEWDRVVNLVQGSDVIVKLVSHVIHACRKATPGSTMRLKGGELLGRLGSAGALSSEFLSTVPVSDIVTDLRSTEQWHGKHPQPWGVRAITLLLHDFLTDSCPDVCCAASATLSLVVDTPATKAISKTISRQVLRSLYLFQTHRKVEPIDFNTIQTSIGTCAALDSDELWLMNGRSYQDWVSTLAQAMVQQSAARNDPVLKLIAPVCRAKPEFAARVLPFLVFAAMQGEPDVTHMLSQWLSLLMLDTTYPTQAADLAVQIMEYLRVYGIGAKSSANTKLNIDPALIARTALRLGRPALALLHAQSTEPIDKPLLVDVYTATGDTDLLRAVDRGNDIRSRVRIHEQEQSWRQALGHWDVILLGDRVNKDDYLGLSGSMLKQGLYHSLQIYYAGLESLHPEMAEAVAEVHNEALWRIVVVDQKSDDQIPLGGNDVGFNGCVLACLRAIRDRDVSMFETMVNHARDLAVADVVRGGEGIRRLVMLDDLQSAMNSEHVQSLLGAWRALQTRHLYACAEPILALRGTLLRLLGASSDFVTEHFRLMGSLARRSGHAEAGMQPMRLLHCIPSGSMEPWQLEEAHVLWTVGDERASTLLVQACLDDALFESPAMAKLRADALRLCGEWMAQTRQVSTDAVMDLLNDSVELCMSDTKHSKIPLRTLAKAHFALAKYCESQYTAIQDRLGSKEWEKKQKLLESDQREKKRVSEYYGKLNAEGEPLNDAEKKERRELVVRLGALRNHIKAAKQEREALLSDLTMFLDRSVDQYLRCMACIDDSDHDVVFRFTRLWFESKDEIPSRRLIEHCDSISPKKWLPLAAQITSRLAMNPQVFADAVSTVLERAALAYPHDILWTIMSLADGACTAGHAIGTAVRGRYRNADPKQIAAFKIISAVNKERRALTSEYDQLSKAYAELAIAKLDELKNKRGPFNMSKYALSRIRDLNNVVIPSSNGHGVTIHKFEDEFSLAGGLNIPRIVICIGSDGERYKELVKGHDDMRQDAVVQQLFYLVNRLLQDDPEARARKLRLRTYKVIPMGRRHGVMEFVQNCRPLGEYLVGVASSETSIKNSCHSRFRPGDWASIKCRQVMAQAFDNVAKGKAIGDPIRSSYRQVLRHFHPVMRYFFLETFLDPSAWFEATRVFTRSVAVNSIVTYVVGLGDRHPFNILLDMATGEIVYIDFGVCFEQGKSLRIPEVVPPGFRLTPDMVDGMGPYGVEGPLTQCCEETMRVLRADHSSLMTVLSVFLHDPLIPWALSTRLAARIQKDDDADIDMLEPSQEVEGNIESARVLLRLKNKLLGYDFGEHLSVRGQVNRLITEARNPEKLCRLFVGWASWV